MTDADRTDLGRCLVTGATGRVGRALVAALLADGCPVAVLTRSAKVGRALWTDQAVEVRVGDLTDPASLAGVCDAVDTLFHLASYAPRPDEPDIYNAPGHWPVTAAGTEQIMAQARASGVKRILYISTIKAMGDQSGIQTSPADERTPPMPDALYGRAKLAAEGCVLDTGKAAGIKTAVLRLPMVYGLDNEGNIARMVAAVAAGRFPPWPRIGNHRSAIHVEDAVAAAILAARHPASDGETYCVTDGGTYSTRWIYERIRLALGRPIPRWTVPLWLLRGAAAVGTLGERLLGRRMPLTLDGLAKLNGDAWYSSAKLQTQLGFTPRHTLETEVSRLARRLRASPSPEPARPPDRSRDSG